MNPFTYFDRRPELNTKCEKKALQMSDEIPIKSLKNERPVIKMYTKSDSISYFEFMHSWRMCVYEWVCAENVSLIVFFFFFDISHVPSTIGRDEWDYSLLAIFRWYNDEKETLNPLQGNLQNYWICLVGYLSSLPFGMWKGKTKSTSLIIWLESPLKIWPLLAKLFAHEIAIKMSARVKRKC